VKVRVILSGCDDATYVDTEVTEAQFEFLQALTEQVEDASAYRCQPTLRVETA
jgi:hypothetical protein